MRALLLITLAAAVLAAPPKWHQLKGYTFDAYMDDFGRQYKKGTPEHAKRLALFERELALVQKHNANNAYLWKRGINHMSDWTEEEKKTLRGNKVGMKGKFSKPEKIYEAPAGPVPYQVDWRTAQPPVVSSVKNQGQCGSCWAHAATEAIESAEAIRSGRLFVLSQQQITSCTPNPDQCGGTGGCNGAIAELAIDYIKTVGINEEWTYGYTSGFGNSGQCFAANSSSFGNHIPMVNVSGYTLAKHNDAESVTQALAHAGPLAISVDASDWSNYESGIYHGCNYAHNISMDHAVQAVGFGFEPSLGQHYWLVRNSWSPAWGELGYIKLIREPGQEKCGWNVDPQNGAGCRGQTAPQWACGQCGIAFDTLFANAAPLTPHH